MLNNIKVLDFSRLLPGPYATMLLADLGAEVIKVEEPPKGDYMRDFEPKVEGICSFYLAVNRGKKSVSINFRTDEGKKTVYDLVREADVVIESYRPGAMKAFGLDYDTLKEINPRIVYCSMTGYGQKGSLKDKAGHDVNYLSLGGAEGLIAHANGRPVIAGVQIADLSGGMFAAMAILAALNERNVTGKGKYLDIAMLDGILSWFSIIGSQQYLANQPIEAGKLLLAEGVVCYNTYETSDGQYMALGALEQKFWQDFCKKIGREDLLAKQFSKTEDNNEVYITMQNIFKSRTQAEWVEMFKDEDVCLTPVLQAHEVLESAYVKENNMVFEINHPKLGPIKQIHSPLSKNFPQEKYLSPPSLGDNNEEILK